MPNTSKNPKKVELNNRTVSAEEIARSKKFAEAFLAGLNNHVTDKEKVEQANKK